MRTEEDIAAMSRALAVMAADIDADGPNPVTTSTLPRRSGSTASSR
jgi:hypothetical protein